jgi:ABC-type protease/lipase transport system fused ATPase/permease subunit
MAEIHSAIEAMPNGYETQIGERGAGCPAVSVSALPLRAPC